METIARPYIGTGPEDSRDENSPPKWVFCPVSIAVFFAVLTPYATVSLPFRWSLEAQALIQLLIVTALLGTGLRPSGVRNLFGPEENRRCLVGLLLYATAAVQGTAVGLILDNPFYTVAGQSLSMGLLPLAAAAGMLQDRHTFPRQLVLGMVAGFVAAMSLNFGVWAWLAFHGERLRRLYLPNTIAPVGLVPLGALGGLLLLRYGTPPVRRLGATAIVLAVPFTVFTGVRTLWLTVAVALVLFSLLAGSSHRPLQRWARVVRPGAIGVIGLVLAGAIFWWAIPRTNVLQAKVSQPLRGQSWVDMTETLNGLFRWSWTATDGRRGVILVDRHAVPAKRSFRAFAVISGDGPGQCALSLDWFDANGEKLATDRSELVCGHGGETHVSLISIRPPTSDFVRLRGSCIRSTGGRWNISDPRLEGLSPVVAAVVAKDLMELRSRAISAGRWLTGTDVVPDESIGRRLRENQRLVELFSEASHLRKAFGHGLGAIYDLPIRVAGETADTGQELNYIHNFYLFLLFKLGIVGGTAVVTAFGFWIFALVTALKLEEWDRWNRGFLAFALTAWVVYLLWSISSPEILDFRMAPLWGLLLAAHICVSQESAASRE